MATGGEKIEDYSDGLGSEDFSEVACDPCQEDGELHKAVGMCINCHDFLCQRCFDGHRIARPFRKHQLLDKQQIQQSHVSLKRKDKCTEQCAVHEDDMIKYYCLNHSQLGCGVCITLNHKLCDRITYIPHAANDLSNDEEYQQVKSQLKYVMDMSRELVDNYKQKTESLAKACLEVVKMIHDYRRELNEALDAIEVDLIKNCKRLKLEEFKKIEDANDKSITSLADLHALVAKVETCQNNRQNCNLYIAMMNTKEKMKLAKEKIQEAKKGQSSLNNQVHFIANKNFLNRLRHAEVFGTLILSGASHVLRPEETRTTVEHTEQTTVEEKENTKRILKTEYVDGVSIRSKNDKRTCFITGMVDLSNNRMLLADFKYKQYGNGNVKLVDIKRGDVITHLTLSSAPRDAAKINNSLVVLTLPRSNKVAIVSLEASAMTVYNTLDVDGECWGVDYGDGKLAVSFCTPHKVQVLTLQGAVLHTITTDKQRQPLFYCPYCVVLVQDNSSLFVSNFSSDNMVHVKFDGTVVGTYTDRGLQRPRGLSTDSNGNVYVCGWDSNTILQITPDCKKTEVLLTSDDGLLQPCAMSYSETQGRLYVGMMNKDVLQVYRVVLGIKYNKE